jgi:hypothetical protein
LERALAAIAAQQKRGEDDMAGAIVIGEGGKPTRAQQLVADLTGTAAKDLPLIEAALKAEVLERLEGEETFEAGRQAGHEEGAAETRLELESEIASLRSELAALEGRLREAAESQGAIEKQGAERAGAVSEAEKIMLGQEDTIAGLRTENDALRTEIERLQAAAEPAQGKRKK